MATTTMTMTSSTHPLQTKLDALYDIIRQLTPTSPDSAFAPFGAFFADDCKVYLKSMNLHRMPGVTPQGAIDDMRQTLQKVIIEDRVVLNSTVTPDGLTLFCETRQRLNVMGEVLEPFFETEVVTFNDEGLIRELKLYNCWSPIVRIVQDKTGKGPYSEGDRRVEWEGSVKEMVMKKMARSKELQSNVCCV